MVVTGASLRAVPIFASLSDVQLDWVAGMAVQQRCKAQAVLFAEGQPSGGLYIVQSGRVALGHRSIEREQIFTILGPGELLDVAPLIDGRPHAWMAWALGPALVYRVHPAPILELLEINAVFREALLAFVAAELRTLAGIVGDLTLKDVTARIAGVLLQCAQEEGVPLADGLAISRTVTTRELAARSGTVREVAHRTLRRLEEAHLIDHRAGKITILDIAGLRRRAEGYPLSGETSLSPERPSQKE